ncbi:hypothetical protein B0O99DRAFT_694764 [Bisporella sp. PMI_857]|nr:hypothetical protein B0O99DRAFT_694764 [Bisporella sp. PMI_857]
MANLLFLPLFLTCISPVAGWTYTGYYRTSVVGYVGGSSSTYNIPVIPTGPVTPTSTGTSTTLFSYRYYMFGSETTYPITVTELFLPPNASACRPIDGRCSSTSTTNLGPSIDTSYYAPVVVSAPSSCTKTSFLYTTSQTVLLNNLGQLPSTDLSQQATESAVAIFVTTYVYTLSTNLGGQPVTTTRCDVYLKEGAILGLLPTRDEASYLEQCVDPRRYLCTSTSTRSVSDGGCPITGGAYPPGEQTGGMGSTSVATTSPTSKGGVGGLGALASQGLLLLTLPVSVLILPILF